MNQPRARLAGIDLNLLVALDALLAERSVTRAARRVGLSQSAMSHALARLRAVTGDELLVRTARELAPTPRALALREPVAAALARLEEALTAPPPFDPASARARVQIAAVDLAQITVLPRLVAHLSRAAPGVDVALRGYPDDVTRVLAAAECDLAIGMERRLPHLRQEPLFRDRFVCLVRRGHPCLGRRLGAREFAALGHVVVTPRATPRGLVDAALRGRKLKRRVAFTAPSFLAAALAVAASDLVLTASERVARLITSAALATFAPPLRLPPIAITMAWHPRKDGDPLLAWLRAELARLAAAPPEDATPAAPSPALQRGVLMPA